MNEAPTEPAAVLIVGAGPTGLSLANVLTRYGRPGTDHRAKTSALAPHQGDEPDAAYAGADLCSRIP